MELHEWAPPERIAGWVRDATHALLARVDDLADDDDRWMVPHSPIVNPPIWEIAHAAWFAEWFVLRRLHGREPLLDHVDARYDSGAVPHETRWQLTYPDAKTTRDYVQRVGDALADVVLDDAGLDSTSHYALYAVVHLDAHSEALTYTRQTLGWPSPPGLEPPSDLAVGGAVAPPSGDRRVDGGRLLLGALRSQPFVLDNEKWAHAVEVGPFAMAVTPVTVADFAAFVDDGGYDRASAWSAEGWAWRQRTGAVAPRYWRRGDGGWEERHFDRWRPIDDVADHPMAHVCWWEAEAWCAWAGRRLPTEAEWELAATTDRHGAKRWWYPWGDRDPEPADAALDGRSAWTVPVGEHAIADGPWGHRQLIGNVWEWTSSTFAPYPHFEPDAYRDNSEPWFGSRKVLRGGSWATQSRYVRSTFRNYFTPERNDVFAGFRTCARG
jgi:iron(II)-dependent oxidoreductase